MIIKGSLKDNLLYGNKNKIQDNELISYIKKFKLFNEVQSDELNIEVTNKSLSSGQMQKISFIRALLSNPELLILDESTSNIDINSKKEINTQLNKLDITIINSTHNVQELNYDAHIEIDIVDNKRVLRTV